MNELRDLVAAAATNRAGEVTDHSYEIADAVLAVLAPILAVAKETTEQTMYETDAPTPELFRALLAWEPPGEAR